MGLQQTINGNGLEYALADAFYRLLRAEGQTVTLHKNAKLEYTRACFSKLSRGMKAYLRQDAEVTVRHFIKREPNLTAMEHPKDKIVIQMQGDMEGKRGDARDVLLSNPRNGWEIGISVKNNHRAVKHARLSGTINFSKEWTNIACGKEFFDKTSGVFKSLRELKAQGLLWRDIKGKGPLVYKPVLAAFVDQVVKLSRRNKSFVRELFSYLMGHRDFYKVIRKNGAVEVYRYDFTGDWLELDEELTHAKRTPVDRPTKVKSVTMAGTLHNKAIVEMDNGWTFSFRLHSASTKVEPSLKFDVQVLEQPDTVQMHALTTQRWREKAYPKG